MSYLQKSKMIRLLQIIILLFLSSCTSSYAQDQVPSFIKDSLDIYINRSMRDNQIPGVSVAIIKDGKIIALKGYGVTEFGGQQKVDENTLFMIGSNTKAFTATALSILDAEKKLSLDDKVKKWLPDFTLYDPWVANEANIRDLLCHRLGFETFQGDFMFFDSDLNTAEVREKFGKVKPMHSFRSKWGYTNAAFMTAGEIIPKVTNQTWAAYIRERILQPLGMTNTLMLSEEILKANNKATAHTVYHGKLMKIPYGHIDNIAPAGSMSSSASDMSKWVMAQLDNGIKDGKEVIPAKAIAQTRLPHSILGNGGHLYNKAHFALYGLGWFMEEYSGRKIVSHTGGVNGFVTSVALVPEEKLGIVVLTNTDANNFYEALRYEIMDAFLGLPYRNYSQVYLNYQQQQDAATEKDIDAKRDTIATKPKPALPLEAFPGNYNHEIYGNMKMTLENNALIMRFEHHKGRYGKLEALGGNRFLCTYSEPLYGIKVLEFTIADGKVKSLTVRVADFVEYTPYEFKKINP